ncbi:MAG: phospho-N-acetylmuramoyl-pentapeptide-transferase, partial [Traorella sp.]
MEIFIWSLVLGLLLSLGIYPIAIPFLHKIKFGQSIREEGPQSHKKKTGTPTMGGIVFVLVPLLVLAILSFESYFDTKIQILIIAYVGYSFIGLVDDFLIVVKKNND